MTRVIVGRASAVVALLMLALGIGLVVGLGQATHAASSTDSLPRGADSTRAVQVLDTIPQQSGSTAVAVLTAEDGGRLDAATLMGITRALGGLDVSGVGAAAAVTPSQDGKAAVAVLSVSRAAVDDASSTIGELRAQLRADVPAGVRAQVTGPAAVQADLAAVFDGANVRLLAVTAAVVAILLVVTYRSPVLWVVPLLVVGLADQAAAALATHVLNGVGLPFDGSVTGILSVLVFGAGTDYALLLISRYRDELRRHDSRYDAMRLALRRTAGAVLSSATTVVLGVLTLVLSLTPTTRALGVASAVGIVVAALFALVMLPATLVLLGRWVFWPRVPRHVEASASSDEPDGHALWHRVGALVARRTTLTAAGVVVVLVVLSGGLLSLKVGLPGAEQFIKKPEAIAASKRLAQHFPAGSSDPTTLVTTDPSRAVTAVRAVGGVETVRQTGSAGGWTAYSVVLDSSGDSAASQDTVRRLRSALDAVPGTSHVGGTAAQALDASSTAARDRAVIFPAILLVVLVGLLVLLRSVVAPVLLVLTVLATYVAATGAGWLVFTHVLGFSGVQENALLFSFLFLVALGVDYNIFLVARAREEAAAHGSRNGMLRALAATGGVITSAGILLAAVFAVLGVLPLVALAQVGVIICIGVLLDTLLVRTVLVPALALALGDRFWWPGRSTASSG